MMHVTRVNHLSSSLDTLSHKLLCRERVQIKTGNQLRGSLIACLLLSLEALVVASNSGGGVSLDVLGIAEHVSGLSLERLG